MQPYREKVRSVGEVEGSIAGLIDDAVADKAHEVFFRYRRPSWLGSLPRRTCQAVAPNAKAPLIPTTLP